MLMLNGVYGWGMAKNTTKALRIDTLTPGARVTLGFDTRDGINTETATFLGIDGTGDARTARFRSPGTGTGEFPTGPYEWDAYRYNRRWSYGSSAQALRLIAVEG